MDQAKALIAASPGFVSLRVERCLERPSQFPAPGRSGRPWKTTPWASAAQPAYEEWRAALHHFYDPFPLVEHYETVGLAGRSR